MCAEGSCSSVVLPGQLSARKTLVPSLKSLSAWWRSRSFPNLFHDAIVREPEQAYHGATLSTSFTKLLRVLVPIFMPHRPRTASSIGMTDCDDPIETAAYLRPPYNRQENESKHTAPSAYLRPSYGQRLAHNEAYTPFLYLQEVYGGVPEGVAAHIPLTYRHQLGQQKPPRKQIPKRTRTRTTKITAKIRPNCSETDIPL